MKTQAYCSQILWHIYCLCSLMLYICFVTGNNYNALVYLEVKGQRSLVVILKQASNQKKY